MKRTPPFVVPLTVLALFMPALESGCNDVGDCPSASSITPGGACSTDNLECSYTLQTPSPTCDGTTVEGGLATSCVCTKGTWVCPSAVSCGGGEDAGGETRAEAGGEAEVETGIETGAENGVEAGIETGAEIGVEAGIESGGEAGAESGSDGGSD